jgi:endonuclease YncB( thermonuclease family)
VRLLVTLLLAFALPAAAVTIEGKVVFVADGDTITILDAAKAQHRIRIHGIDAPEKAQAFEQRSKESMSRLAFGMEAKADCHKKDRYERRVCVIWVRPPDCPDCGLTLDVGLAQITQGLAWHYKKFEKEQTVEDRARYADAEVEARARRVGLWADKNPTAPWEWRAARSAAKP